MKHSLQEVHCSVIMQYQIDQEKRIEQVEKAIHPAGIKACDVDWCSDPKR